MAGEKWHSWEFIGTGALKKGTMLKLGAVAGQCDVSTALSDVPAGIAMEDLAADAGRSTTAPANIGVGMIHGEVYKVIASTTIAIGANLGPTTAGKAVSVTVKATYETATEYAWGIALTAGGAGGTDIVEMLFMPQLASLT